jgi:hypothetical protein
MTSASPWQERENPSHRSVQLSARDLQDAARLMKLLAGCSDNDSAPRYASGPRAALIEAAREELNRRRRRMTVLPESMFGEAAWEILLQLYIEQQGARLNIARLVDRLGIPGSSALRWLNYLQDRQLVRREDHPTDQRVVFIMLTTAAMDALDAYFSEALSPAP